MSELEDFGFQKVLELGEDRTEYERLEGETVETVEFEGRRILKVRPETLRRLADRAIRDISHLFRSSHLQQLRDIVEDAEASENDRFVALEMLKNANISSGGVLPSCQDTGTAIVVAKKGETVWTGADDEQWFSAGVMDAYTQTNLRYSQMAPTSMFEEKNTGTNLPAQVEIYSTPGDTYELLFITKGGGSANKTFLFQQTPAVLNEERMMEFLEEKMRSIGTAACPPYHLAIVIGGMSAELNLKTVKLASCRYLDGLPTTGNERGRAFRDVEMEARILELAQNLGIGAQFGGKYFCHDVRVIRMSRHAASCPVGIGVSCSADRQAKARITEDGVFLEKLERNPARFMPAIEETQLPGDVVRIDLNRPMSEIRKTLSGYPIKTRLSLTGPMIVARDIAHAKVKERLDAGEPMPEYFKNHPVYYAGPAKTPEGYASGSFGPTTAGRMDSYVEQLQALGGSLVMLAKGNRSRQVTDACKEHGGFYLGSIGGPAAILALDCIRKVEVLEYEELGMEAIWRIEVENFPAFIVVDDKGNDFFAPVMPARR